MRQIVQMLLVALALGALLAGCGGGITQTTETASYRVELALDDVRFGERTATITVLDKAGQPAAVDQVVVAPVMEAMGMLAPEQAAQPLGAGRYQAKGDFFSMLGEWEFDVRVAAGGAEELARFKVMVVE